MNRHRIARLLSIASRIVIAGVADDLSKKYIGKMKEATPEFIKELLEYVRKEYGQGSKKISLGDQNYTVEIRKSDVDKIAKVAVGMVLEQYSDNEDTFNKGVVKRELNYICNIMSVLLNLKHRYPQYWDEDLKNWFNEDISSFKTYQELLLHFELHKGLISPDDEGRPSLPLKDKSEGSDYKYIKSLPTEAKVNGYTIKRLDDIDQLPKQKWVDLECGEGSKYCITVSKSYFNSYGKPPFFWVFKENGDKFTQNGMIIPSALKTDPDQALRNADNTGMMSGNLIQELAPFLSKYNVSFENGGLLVDDVWEKGTWNGGEWNHKKWRSGTWEDGTWKVGLWNYGTWKKGIWEHGRWVSGTWLDGTWNGGIWEDGDWKNGTWENGKWLDGVFSDGTWKGGTWEYGSWKGGTWLDGIWENGFWYDGTWKYGTWYNGAWKNGTWENGTWEDGTWLSGTWKGGTWLNGDWNGGIWEDGDWKNGDWYRGTWKKGHIFDQELNKYVESTVSPKEYFENKKTKAASIQ